MSVSKLIVTHWGTDCRTWVRLFYHYCGFFLLKGAFLPTLANCLLTEGCLIANSETMTELNFLLLLSAGIQSLADLLSSLERSIEAKKRKNVEVLWIAAKVSTWNRLTHVRFLRPDSVGITWWEPPGNIPVLPMETPLLHVTSLEPQINLTSNNMLVQAKNVEAPQKGLSWLSMLNLLKGHLH